APRCPRAPRPAGPAPPRSLSSGSAPAPLARLRFLPQRFHLVEGRLSGGAAPLREALLDVAEARAELPVGRLQARLGILAEQPRVAVALLLALRPLERLPVLEHLAARGRGVVAEDVRMAPHHLGRDALDHLRHVEEALFGRDLRMEDDLEEEVAQLTREVLAV